MVWSRNNIQECQHLEENTASTERKENGENIAREIHTGLFRDQTALDYPGYQSGCVGNRIIELLKAMDFEGARRNADERLNQELTRIRNLPKRSKIKIVNQYGLKHASLKNVGLLKELEINLGVISREQRRVANECNKMQKDFKEIQRKSLSKFLPPLTQDEGVDKVPAAHKKPQRQRRNTAVFDQTPVWLKGRRVSITEKKREILLDMTKKSKERTFKIISQNNKKTSVGLPLPPIRDNVELDEDPWITRINRQRKKAFNGSCFPSLLGEDKGYTREPEKYRGNLAHNEQGAHSPATYDERHLTKRTFRGTVYEKVLKMPDPANIPHLNPRDPKLYHVVMKVKNRKGSKLVNSDAVVARRNTVFTRHWK